ncbi:MAG: glycyl-radical enzyme activating protein [Clostridiales Family XIII bacterium]|jgi:pyruvate formate lyase activating enzyme|nr:glycyl-radical enzyme activating protein [Clostridiales Family XIII bacterium]
MIRLLDIQRMSSEDGPGLRTTAFLKGCSLACTWCHNPESISMKGEVLWHRARCMGCSGCAEDCPQGGISLNEDRLTIDRSRCLGCFTCMRSCPTGAIEAKGEEISEEQLCAELLKDRAYFGADGGVTLSGGEALLQKESICLLRMLKESGVNTAVDTCGQIGTDTLREALPYTDVLLYDVKIADSGRHKQFTGASNELILKNLSVAADWTAKGGRLWIRTPIIPGATDSDENIRDIGEILAALPKSTETIERWELCAFNNLCESKYDSLEKTWIFRNVPLIAKERMNTLAGIACASGACGDIRITGATASEREV